MKFKWQSITYYASPPFSCSCCVSTKATSFTPIPDPQLWIASKVSQAVSLTPMLLSVSFSPNLCVTSYFCTHVNERKTYLPNPPTLAYRVLMGIWMKILDCRSRLENREASTLPPLSIWRARRGSNRKQKKTYKTKDIHWSSLACY